MALIDSLVSYWKLDEASGDAVDSHGSNTLTETGGTIDAATGIISGARDFESADTEYFLHADNADLSCGDIACSWSVWIKQESSASGFPVVFKKGNAGGTREYILYSNGGQLEFFVSDGSSTAAATWGSTVSNATWYHVVCTHDPVANQIAIIVNNGTPVTASHSGGIQDNAGEFQLGAGVDQSLYWDGLIDEFGFWKKVLSAAEITSLYNGGAGLAYPFSAAATSYSPRSGCIPMAILVR